MHGADGREVADGPAAEPVPRPPPMKVPRAERVGNIGEELGVGIRLLHDPLDDPPDEDEGGQRQRHRQLVLPLPVVALAGDRYRVAQGTGRHRYGYGRVPEILAKRGTGTD